MMMPNRRTRLLFLLWTILLLSVQTAWAQQAAPDPVAAAGERFEEIRRLAQDPASDTRSALAALIRELERIRAIADGCADQAEVEIARLRRQQAALGAQATPATRVVDDPAEGALPAGQADTAGVEVAPTRPTVVLAQMRASLAADLAGAEARQARCRLLELNSNDLSAELVRREQRLLAGTLLTRGPHVLEVVQHNLSILHEWPQAGESLLRLVTGVEELGPLHAGPLMALALAAGLAGARLRRQPLRIIPATGQVPFTSALLISLRAVVHQRAPLLLVLLAVNGYLAFLLFHEGLPPIFAKLALGALLLLAAAMTAQLLLDPPAPGFPLISIADGLNRKLSRRLQLLALLFLLGLLLKELGSLHVIDLPKRQLLFDAYVLVLGYNVLSLVRLIGRQASGLERLFKRTLPILGMLGILAAMWLGYRDLARFLFWNTVGTVFALLLMLFLSRLVADLQDGLDVGRYGWQRSLRRFLGLYSNEPVPGLGWLILLVQLVLWTAWLALVLRLWGLPDPAFQQIARLFSEGFEIGSVTIVPSRLLWAVVTLLLALVATRWIQGQLEKRWLVRTRMERGAREAIATSFGYAAIAAVLLLALSMAGIDSASSSTAAIAA